MSYPGPAHLGPHGVVNATFRPAGTAPDLVYPVGTAVDHLATGATTGGGFGLYRWSMGPAPTGPDPHFHRSISESFFVLTGSVRIFTGEQWIDTGPGDFVHVPPGGIHAFRNESGEPASMLLHFAPGAPREAYFDGLLTLAERTDEEREAFFLAHDTHLVQPDVGGARESRRTRSGLPGA